MRALTAGLRSVGLCVSRRLPRRAPAGLPQNKENPTKLYDRTADTISLDEIKRIVYLAKGRTALRTK